MDTAEKRPRLAVGESKPTTHPVESYLLARILDLPSGERPRQDSNQRPSD
jgi:hypothetical protein